MAVLRPVWEPDGAGGLTGLLGSGKRINLTKLELELLRFLAIGTAIQEQALVRKKDRNTLARRLMRIKHKLDCDTTPQVMAKAVLLGLISIEDIEECG